MFFVVLQCREEDNKWKFHRKHKRNAGNIRVLGGEGTKHSDRDSEDGLREQSFERVEIKDVRWYRFVSMWLEATWKPNKSNIPPFNIIKMT